MHINHQPENLTVIVDANLTLRKLQAKLELSGQFLPVGPFENDVTIKNIVDYNLLGPHAIEHGILKNWVLGLTAHVNGEDVEFGAQVMKNVAGYDMTKLFIGAQCKLGKVKQVIFKVLPHQYKVGHEPSKILDGSRIVLELSQIDAFIPDIKKEAGTYYHYEGLGILDVNVDNTVLNIKARIFGAKYIKLVNGFPLAEKSKHPQLIENIHSIFNSRILKLNGK
ncbi:MAG: FAD-binding oxidoreductase [Candidatus Marinimicrobia bacterium]|nr:FAD-binding oxidoreductase [Candidatus Neomarinimicrobiota bacterium]